MEKREAPIDFFSWHIYATSPEKVVAKAERIKKLLIKYGFSHAESILNEWNYVKGWTDEYVYSLKTIHGIKGATFVMAVITESQKCDGIDMLMYYDTRHSVFCGAFDYYTYETLKGYYPLMWYGMFYDMAGEIRSENNFENIYSLCGVDENNNLLMILTHYSDEDDKPAEEIAIDFGKEGNYEIYLLDETHDGELVETTNELKFTMKNQSSILIKEIRN